jgi:hypothetical protein
MNGLGDEGGIVPVELRSAFQTWVQDHPDETVQIYGEERSIEWLTGQLWHCTDVLPESSCNALELPRGSTYGQAARQVAQKRSGKQS